MHCDDPPCMKQAPEGAIYKRKDGIVIIDPVKAKGRRKLVNTCPYGAIWWNEEAQVAQKCTGCAHLIDTGWTETRCSQVCPTDAIKLYLADDEEIAEIAAAEGLEAYKPELGTRPRVLYKNLYRWQKVFVAASVAYKDTDECAEGAILTARNKGTDCGEALANNYGEVIVNTLEPGTEYEVTIEAAGYKLFSTLMNLDDSLNIGLVMLEKA